MFGIEPLDRRDFERALVRKEFPGFRQFNGVSSFGFTGWVTPKAGSGSYQLKLEAPPSYPYGSPSLFVASPQILWMYGGQKSINSLGTTHAYHTYASSPDNSVEICHTSGWDPSFSCVQVLLKGVIWLESFAIHLCTGATIAEIIDSFEDYYATWSTPLILPGGPEWERIIESLGKAGTKTDRTA